MADLAGRQPPRGIATIWRYLDHDTDNGTLGLHSQAVGRQGLKGVVRAFLGLMLKSL